MTANELQKIVAECLPDEMLKRNGQILYSGLDTVRPGKFYFLGYNPAADGTNPPLREVLSHEEKWSAYTQQCWRHPRCGSAVCPDFTLKPHQKRVQAIMLELGLTPEETFASNLLLVESRDVDTLIRDPHFEEYFDSCWRVHKRLLARVKPEFIVCLGHGDGKRRSAFSLMCEKATNPVSVKHSNERSRGSAAFKSFVGTFQDNGFKLTATVLGVIHPSRPMNARGLGDFIRN